MKLECGKDRIIKLLVRIDQQRDVGSKLQLTKRSRMGSVKRREGKRRSEGFTTHLVVSCILSAVFELCHQSLLQYPSVFNNEKIFWKRFNVAGQSGNLNEVTTATATTALRLVLKSASAILHLNALAHWLSRFLLVSSERSLLFFLTSLVSNPAAFASIFRSETCPWPHLLLCHSLFLFESTCSQGSLRWGKSANLT